MEYIWDIIEMGRHIAPQINIFGSVDAVNNESWGPK